MKKLLITFAALFVSVVSFAQNDKAAFELFEKAVAQFEKGGVEMNGVAHYGDGAFNLMLKMDHERFCGSVADFAIWFDGKTQWFQRSGEIYISEPTPQEQQSANLYLLMKNAKEFFEIRKIDSKQLIKDATDGIQLTPRSYNELQNAKLFFDKDNRLLSLRASFYNGSSANIEIISFKNGLKYKESDFTCDTKKYDAEVIDMR